MNSPRVCLERSIREALPLATRDRILAGAAKRCGVPLKWRIRDTL